MAKINGIEIKSVKLFKDHEGATIAQGNVYFHGKKLGFWSQDARGGSDTYDFDTSVLDDAFARFLDSDLIEEKYKSVASLDSLMYELLNLNDRHKTYKKYVKKGYNTYVLISDGFHENGYFSVMPDGMTRDEILDSDYHRQFLVVNAPKMFKDATIRTNVYMSESDFDITC